MLTVSNLRKSFDTVVAVDDVTLEVHRGEVFGLLGPNGAGKTTAIRTILDIIKPDSGSISFDGKPFTVETWNNIGYLPEERGLYRKSKILATILYFAALKGMSEAEARPLAIKWLERFDLKDSAFRKVDELSKGNQQKVQLICSLIHSPQLLIFDEPFSGLDPVNQILLKDILLELRRQNIAIVFSTHQMEQVEKLCDRICLINKGKTVLSGSITEVKKAHGNNTVRLDFDGDGTFLKTFKNVIRADVYPKYAELEFHDASDAQKILVAASEKLTLRKFEIVEPSLQAIFVATVGGKETLEKAAAQTFDAAPVRASGKTSSVPKKELIGLLGGVVVGPVIIALQLFKPQPDVGAIALGSALLLYTVFRFMMARQKAAKLSAAEDRHE